MGMVVVNATFDWGACWSFFFLFFFFFVEAMIGFLARIEASGHI